MKIFSRLKKHTHTTDLYIHNVSLENCLAHVTDVILRVFHGIPQTTWADVSIATLSILRSRTIKKRTNTFAFQEKPLTYMLAAVVISDNLASLIKC